MCLQIKDQQVIADLLQQLRTTSGAITCRICAVKCAAFVQSLCSEFFAVPVQQWCRDFVQFQCSSGQRLFAVSVQQWCGESVQSQYRVFVEFHCRKLHYVVEGSKQIGLGEQITYCSSWKVKLSQSKLQNTTTFDLKVLTILRRNYGENFASTNDRVCQI